MIHYRTSIDSTIATSLSTASLIIPHLTTQSLRSIVFRWGLTLSSSVTTRDSPSKLGLSSRCSIGSNSRVSSRLWTIISSWLSAWRRGEIKGDSIVSRDWCGEFVNLWIREFVKSWKSEIVKSWCFRQKARKEEGEAADGGQRAVSLALSTAPSGGVGQQEYRIQKKQLSADRGKAVRWWRKRREQDSNLRTGFAGYTLSRRASSTTRAPLQNAVHEQFAAAKLQKI